MRRCVVLVALLLFTGVGPGAGIPPAFGGHASLSFLLPGNPLEGSHLFFGKGCLRCHAVHGIGGSTGPDLGRGIMNRPLLEIAGVMWNHSPGMEHVFQERHVVRPKFGAEEMASLLSFLYYLGSLDPPGDAAVGARLFRQNGCQGCHSLGGKGGTVGPSLDEYSRYASPLFLTTALWNKGQAMAKAMAKRRVPRPTFRGNDIPDLLAYIRASGGGLERVYAPPGSPEQGEELFREKRCVECHSVRGDGGKVGPDLGATLTGSLMRIAGRMWNHGPKMWAKMAERGIQVPSFRAEEMSNLISYLYFFQFIDAPGDAGRGQAVYREKRCGACHALRGVGEKVGPDLAEEEKLDTPVEIITEMWNHAGHMEEKMLKENVAWPVLKGGEMADLISYLLSIRRGTAQPVGPEGSASQGNRR
ncbi:MAG: c-type cytochrome [Candidatus Methylomirabilia bacterium]